METSHAHESNCKIKGYGVVQQLLHSQLCGAGEDLGPIGVSYVYSFRAVPFSLILSNASLHSLGGKDSIQVGCLKELMGPLSELADQILGNLFNFYDFPSHILKW
ncbi:hCG1776440 [Homo sapiens]|nr:unknown [Homo sapiens]EAW70425.1 hCG1776440 [Homo sapiens]CAB66786.1 hypothetical protein [Homo sapiens]CAG38473.1 DKFZP434E2135 [Homo sapiens]